MKKTTRNFLLSAAATVVGAGTAAAVSYTVTKKLLEIAIDRKEPTLLVKGMSRLTGYPEMTAYLSEAGEAAQKLEGMHTEQVEITSRDGLLLVGHFRSCENPKRVIIAMHGWRSSWSRDFGIMADFWHDCGCSVLYIEQRGQHNSGGDYMGFGLLERFDCLDWIGWVNERTKGKTPIYLVGMSMGATGVLMTAGQSLPENVRGIIADCGFTSPHAIWKHVMERNLHIPYTGIQSTIIDDMCRKKINISAGDYSAVDAMRECRVPVLFIHGTDDRFVPVEMSYENYKNCAAPKRLFVVPGADHAMSYCMDKAGYEAAVKAFWDEYDEA